MFLHNLKYEILVSLRARDLIIWLIIFPIALGTFFKIAFGNVYEKDQVFKTIDTAIVETERNDTFRSVVESIEQQDQPLLKVQYVDEAKGMQLLEDGDVKGIIYVGPESKLSLKVASNGTESTILKTFIERYTTQETVINDALEHNMANVQAVIGALSEDLNIENRMPLTEGNTDPFAAYFFNIIAMVAIFGSVTGLHISITNQGNLSDLGARRCCSPTQKFKSLMAGVVGSCIAQIVCVVITVLFLLVVLGVDFRRLPLVFLAGCVGSIMGVAFGFFIGSIGNMSLNTKVGISMVCSLSLCFMSGLMMGDIKALIETHAPIVNDLNPAAVICDSMYYLNVDEGLDRFFIKIVTMAGYSVLFVTLGIILTRRKKYASL